MKESKTNYYNLRILNCLIDGAVVSTKQIAAQIGVSEKTIRNKIYLINEYLSKNDLGIIRKKPRVGIWLECSELQKQQIHSILMNRDMADFNDDSRVYDMLKIFFRLRPWERITTQKLSDELYFSPPTILKIIRQCEQWLQQYNIRIVNEKNHGYRLECQENEFRVGMKNLIMQNFDIEKIKQNIEYYFYNIDTKLIQKSIIETENEWNYRFTDESFYEIFIYCCIAYQRREIKAPIINNGQEIKILEEYNEYSFTMAIFKKLENKFKIHFSTDEILFLTTQIMCSKVIGFSATDEMIEQIKKYDNKLIEFVDLSLNVIGSILDVDFSKDEKLKESLIIHLRPTIFRLRHGYQQTNSLIHYIKEEYKKVFRATMSISIIFEEFYGLQLTENEVGYIVLYIQSALERMTHSYCLLLLADYSGGHAQLLSERIKKIIPEISEIQVMSTHDFKLYNNKEADLILSTTEIEDKDPRIVIVPNLLSENGILRVRQIVETLIQNEKEKNTSFSPKCYPLLDPDLIFVQQEFVNKEELLKFMSEAMQKKGYVSTGFYRSVMEREAATTTSIGNMISVTHGTQSEVIDPKVSIAILKHPIVWNEGEMVDIVFLLGFRMTTVEEIKRIQRFYKEYISIIEQEENIRKIRAMQSSVDLYKFLIQ